MNINDEKPLNDDLLKNSESKPDAEEPAFRSAKITDTLEPDEILVEVPIEEVAQRWYNKFSKPDIMDRLMVHLIDSAAVYIIYAVLYYNFVPGAKFSIPLFIFLYFFVVYTNLAQFVTWIILYATNGYTLGKYIYKHRVFRMDGERLTIRDAIVRSLLIKGFCNTASCGIMNIVSIIVSYVKPYSRPAHDIAAQTITVQVKSRKKNKNEKKVTFD